MAACVERNLWAEPADLKRCIRRGGACVGNRLDFCRKGRIGVVMGRRFKAAAGHRAHLANCGALGGASVNRDAANQRSPTSCQQLLSRPLPSPSARSPPGVQAVRKQKRRKNPRPRGAVAKPPKLAEAQPEARVTKRERLFDSPQSAGGRQHRRNDAGDKVAAA